MLSYLNFETDFQISSKMNHNIGKIIQYNGIKRKYVKSWNQNTYFQTRIFNAYTPLKKTYLQINGLFENTYFWNPSKQRIHSIANKFSDFEIFRFLLQVRAQRGFVLVFLCVSRIYERCEKIEARFQIYFDFG